MTIPELETKAKLDTIEALLTIAAERFDEHGLVPDENQKTYEKMCYRLNALSFRLRHLNNL